MMGVLLDPTGAGEFESGSEEVSVGALDQPRADGQAGGGVVELVEAVFKITQSAARRRVFFRASLRFEAVAQGKEDLVEPTLF
jgi:hypothetical protein